MILILNQIKLATSQINILFTFVAERGRAAMINHISAGLIVTTLTSVRFCEAILGSSWRTAWMQTLYPWSGSPAKQKQRASGYFSTFSPLILSFKPLRHCWDKRMLMNSRSCLHVYLTVCPAPWASCKHSSRRNPAEYCCSVRRGLW